MRRVVKRLLEIVKVDLVHVLAVGLVDVTLQVLDHLRILSLEMLVTCRKD